MPPPDPEGPWRPRRPRRWRDALRLHWQSRARTVAHHVTAPGWTLPPLRIAVLSDLHACAPWTTTAHLRAIAAQTNATAPDLVVLAGDFIASPRMPGRVLGAPAVMAALAGLRARLGIWSVLGNHDWWDCPAARQTRFARNSVIDAHAGHPATLLRNAAVRIATPQGHFWLAGLDSRQARKELGQPGFDDWPATRGQLADDAPAILLAHEPDIFAEGDPRPCLQISGHTHGGQISLFGHRPVVPSAHGARYAWGHVEEGGRHLVVSGGVGFSGLPLRLGQPPEITLITLSGVAR